MTDTPPPMHFWCLTDDYSLVLIKAMICALFISTVFSQTLAFFFEVWWFLKCNSMFKRFELMDGIWLVPYHQSDLICRWIFIWPNAYSQSLVVLFNSPLRLLDSCVLPKKWCLKCFFGNSVWFHGRNEADGSQSGKIDDRLLALDSTLLCRIQGCRTKG